MSGRRRSASPLRDALSDPTRLGDGFDLAMWISAAIVAAAGVAAFALLRADDAADTGVDDGPYCHRCPVDGPLSSAHRS